MARFVLYCPMCACKIVYKTKHYKESFPGEEFSEDTPPDKLPKQVRDELLVASSRKEITCKKCKATIEMFRMGDYKHLFSSTLFR